MGNLTMKGTVIGMMLFSAACFGQVKDFESIRNKIINLGSLDAVKADTTDFRALKPLLKDVDIVMLGEQAHGEDMTYKAKVKLIQYLHKEMGFDLLLFEAGIYSCSKALEQMDEGENVRFALAHSLYPFWYGVKEFVLLSDYITETRKTESPLDVFGFDNQLTGKYSKQFFLSDLMKVLNSIDTSLTKSKDWEHLEESVSYLTSYRLKEFKKNDPASDTSYLNSLLTLMEAEATTEHLSFWKQTIKSLKVYLSDMGLDTDSRDKQMADNLIWIKEKYPNRKIICWGATSHFLYNAENMRFRSPVIAIAYGGYYKKHDFMGQYIKDKYGSKAYTIGFVTYGGVAGVYSKRKIKPAKEKSVAGLLANSEYDNLLLPLEGISFEGYASRPLSHFYSTNDISKVMDAVIFNREMHYPEFDYDFFRTVYPEKEQIKPESEDGE